MSKHLIFCTLIAFSFFACKRDAGNSDAGGNGVDSTGMGQFAGDEAFKDAHATPGEANFMPSGTMVTFKTPDGKTAKAYTLLPEGKAKKYLFVIHEWWGLNDHVKKEAQRLFEELDSVAVMALDVYDGKVADDPDKAAKYMESVKEARAEAIIKGALQYAGKDAEIGTVGWCFGGGWSLRASILAGNQGTACVMYYGMPVQTAEELAALKAPVLAIFARQDQWITPEVAKSFKDLALATGKQLQLNMFDADHAFANPSNPNFNQDIAQRANGIALQFIKDNL
ncbi:MAG TPA: dienelactone hydrolase family protein [Saprospiraceae bacterium]|nr:dienelactone hydrolase family protein [Saprospiraceae bacterium]HMQ83645.1 dienelactone hydrolase family protein [Saprospiraceae bacterium]